jgi:hypothetical protein
MEKKTHAKNKAGLKKLEDGAITRRKAMTRITRKTSRTPGKGQALT